MDTTKAPSNFGLLMRDLVALLITLIGGTVVAALTIKSYHLYDSKDTLQEGKDLVAILLPMVGTWVGTVLAFYFSRQNFKAAQDSVERIQRMSLEERLKVTPVSKVMIPLNQIDLVRLSQQPADQLKIKELLERMDRSGRKRIPVLGDKDQIEYIVHRSMLDLHISSEIRKAERIDRADLEKLTLNLVLDADAAMRRTCAEGIGIVSANATLADAKNAMEYAPYNCQDVFVTNGGTRQEPIIGWITNVIISQHARA